ncbi:hypothetical protein BDZ45DRAFT_741357 [Acephala macrosclerotiorum]|nr:hypothetical protein BDZ45DRAFT_741357 [Acephala macrosclerotiorum]
MAAITEIQALVNHVKCPGCQEEKPYIAGTVIHVSVTAIADWINTENLSISIVDETWFNG